MNSVEESIRKVAAKVGISKEVVDYAIRLVTSKIMLASITTIVVANLIFSPFFPLYWLALAAGLYGVVEAVHRTDRKIAAERGQSGSGAISAAATGDESTGLNLGKISLSNILSSLFSS
jgi:uncharacterized membrane protein HdeD (DUF308 family)